MNSSVADVPADFVEPGEELGMFRLFEAARGLEARVDAGLEQLGLSISKYMALQHLVAVGGGMSLSALADCRKCVRSNITQLVDRLVADGLVERVNDLNDRRTIQARVTALGAERFAAGTSTIRAIQHELIGQVSSEDRASFLRVLSAFSSS